MSKQQNNNPPKKAKEESPQTSSTVDMMAALLAPLMEFHKTVEEANDGDLRIFWDVRLVRGKDTPFMNAKGSSTLPGLLSSTQQSEAPGIIQKEILEKVAVPLAAKVQDMVCDGALSAALASIPVEKEPSRLPLPASTDVAADAVASAVLDATSEQ